MGFSVYGGEQMNSMACSPASEGCVPGKQVASDSIEVFSSPDQCISVVPEVPLGQMFLDSHGRALFIKD